MFSMTLALQSRRLLPLVVHVLIWLTLHDKGSKTQLLNFKPLVQNMRHLYDVNLILGVRIQAFCREALI